MAWLGMAIYFLFASTLTLKYVRDGHPRFLSRRSPFFKWIYWQSYILSATFAWVVPPLYWGLLSDPSVSFGGLDSSLPSSWLTITFHTLGGFIMLVEMLIARVPMFFSQWIYMASVFAMYLGWCAIQDRYVGGGTATSESTPRVYAFLDTSDRLAPLYYFLCLFFVSLTFLFVCLLHKLRDRFLVALCRRRHRNQMAQTGTTSMTQASESGTLTPASVVGKDEERNVDLESGEEAGRSRTSVVERVEVERRGTMVGRVFGAGKRESKVEERTAERTRREREREDDVASDAGSLDIDNPFY
ncbi:hypothetical protein HK102_004102 [Quaeritorhiza haematococci]|nr:hypothetical protein HK102_004102 [Quaeritorhiza haematococci]